jgi:hypothetical protein
VKPRVEFQLDAKLPLGLAGLRVQVPEQGLAHGLGGRPPESLSAAEHLGLDVDLTCPYARQASVSLLFCAPAHNHLREEFR